MDFGGAYIHVNFRHQFWSIPTINLMMNINFLETCFLNYRWLFYWDTFNFTKEKQAKDTYSNWWIVRIKEPVEVFMYQEHIQDFIIPGYVHNTSSILYYPHKAPLYTIRCKILIGEIFKNGCVEKFDK